MKRLVYDSRAVHTESGTGNQSMLNRLHVMFPSSDDTMPVVHHVIPLKGLASERYELEQPQQWNKWSLVMPDEFGPAGNRSQCTGKNEAREITKFRIFFSSQTI